MWAERILFTSGVDCAEKNFLLGYFSIGWPIHFWGVKIENFSRVGPEPPNAYGWEMFNYRKFVNLDDKLANSSQSL